MEKVVIGILINKGRSACIFDVNYWIAAMKVGSVQERFVDQRSVSAARYHHRLCSVLLYVERRRMVRIGIVSACISKEISPV